MKSEEEIGDKLKHFRLIVWLGDSEFRLDGFWTASISKNVMSLHLVINDVCANERNCFAVETN